MLLNKRNKISIFFLTCLIFNFLTIEPLLGQAQPAQKELILAFLQFPVDLNSVNGKVSAISTEDQKLSDGLILPKGTKFLGSYQVKDKTVTINFESYQAPDTEVKTIGGSSIIPKVEVEKITGVSARIGETFYQNTMSSVLGAIFTSPGSASGSSASAAATIIPKGTKLQININ